MQQQVPVDTNVRVPAAVLAAAARANEFYTAQEDTSGKPEASQEAQIELPLGDTSAPVEAPPAQEPAKEPPAPPTESWEHKYNSMKGRYDSAEKRVQALTRQIQNLENVVATLQAAPPPQQSQTRQSSGERKRLVTDEEVTEYGDGFLDVVGRRAREEIAEELAELRAQNEQLQARLTGVGNQVQMTARERMFQNLSTEIPDWQDMNTDESFNRWLELPDPYSGAIRKNMLLGAYNRNDAFRVAAFFKGFLSEEAALAPAGQQPGPASAPQPGALQRKTPLETFAAPGRARTAAAGAPPEKPYFTRDQISKFYAVKSQAIAHGKWVGQEAKDGDAFEQRIFAAEREGRIR